MQTRREALAAVGLAKPGRGKFSKDAVRWLEDQRAKGVTFSDDNAPVKPVKASKPKPVTIDPEPDTAPVSADPRDTPYLTPSEYRFPEADYRGSIFVEGKKKEVSLREACNTCMVSLVNHMCVSPTVWGDIAVTIERR